MLSLLQADALNDIMACGFLQRSSSFVCWQGGNGRYYTATTINSLQKRGLVRVTETDKNGYALRIDIVK